MCISPNCTTGPNPGYNLCEGCYNNLCPGCNESFRRPGYTTCQACLLTDSTPIYDSPKKSYDVKYLKLPNFLEKFANSEIKITGPGGKITIPVGNFYKTNFGYFVKVSGGQLKTLRGGLRLPSLEEHVITENFGLEIRKCPNGFFVLDLTMLVRYSIKVINMIIKFPRYSGYINDPAYTKFLKYLKRMKYPENSEELVTEIFFVPFSDINIKKIFPIKRIINNIIDYFYVTANIAGSELTITISKTPPHKLS